VTKRCWCGWLLLAVAACTTRIRPAPPLPTTEVTSVAALAAAIEADAKRSDHEPDSKIRAALAADAARDADACLARDAALTPSAAVERDEWLREAEQGLKRP
jgi:hypothetical protein